MNIQLLCVCVCLYLYNACRKFFHGLHSFIHIHSLTHSHHLHPETLEWIPTALRIKVKLISQAQGSQHLLKPVWAPPLPSHSVPRGPPCAGPQPTLPAGAPSPAVSLPGVLVPHFHAWQIPLSSSRSVFSKADCPPSDRSSSPSPSLLEGSAYLSLFPWPLTLSGRVWLSSAC